MRAILMMSAYALVLGGCSTKTDQAAGGSTDSGASNNGVVKREPGSWKTNMSIDKFDVPGAPPEMKKMMEGIFKSISSTEICLTPEAAAKEDLPKALAKQQNAKDCTYSKNEFSGGVLAIDAICKDRRGQEVHLVMAGTAAAKKTDISIDVDGALPTGNGKMTMQMHVLSEWTGPCKDGQKKIDAET